jgi:hypothetical protein
MADDAQRAEADWEAIDEEKECLDGNDTVDESGEQFLCEYCVLFD